MDIRRAISADRVAIVDIWLRSVRATHEFLSEEDIQALLPHVWPGLELCELWLLCSDAGAPIGFLGMSPNAIEAMFIDPDFLRLGGGRQLVRHAQCVTGGNLSVEVNEQNGPARRFYEACGFKIVGRSDFDRDGRPFPLLQMRLAPPVQ